MFGTVINVSPSKEKAAVFTGVGYSLIETLNSYRVEIGDLIDR